MQPRYSLRFENGERQGETVPISGSSFTVGRRPGNSVQVSDPSVSGRHAEFTVEPDGVLVRDLGSTNGTKFGSERISERRLVHGDVVVLGSVKLTLLDLERGASSAAGSGRDPDELELEFDEPARPASPLPARDLQPREVQPREVQPREPAYAAAPVREPAASSADSVRTISADKVAASGKRSALGLVALLGALLGGAGGTWYFLQPSAQGETRSARAVEPVAGNLLERGFSFEGEGGAWEADPTGPAAFGVERGSRHSGEAGLGVFVDAQQWALARSAAVKGSGTRVLTLVGMVRVRDLARARVGLELASTSGSSATTLACSPVLASSADFAPFEFRATVPGAFDVVRAVLLCESASASGGAVDFDDVALVAGGAAQLAAIDEFQFVQHGASSAALFKIDRTLFSDFHVRGAEGGLLARESLAIQKGDTGFALDCGGSGRRTLSLRIDEPLLKGGLATTGSGGYRAHATEFSRSGVTSIIAGAGKDQVRLAFDAPLTLRGRAEGGGMRLEGELAGSTLRLQTSFQVERDEAAKLARAAREAEQRGELGLAATCWLALRDDYPFDAKALDEADAARTRIAEGGLAQLRRLRGEVERARFFRLSELYRQCRRDALAVAVRYAGGEVESDARALALEIDRDSAALEADLARTERARLEGIAGALEASASPQLARRVREYLQGLAGAAAPREEN
ncbi:MAG: FHA domain-containing protein [Planctomycetes bacterium]|nr:FHA domain-containing protein [Planctomycetota bacterium]